MNNFVSSCILSGVCVIVGVATAQELRDSTAAERVVTDKSLRGTVRLVQGRTLTLSDGRQYLIHPSADIRSTSGVRLNRADLIANVAINATVFDPSLNVPVVSAITVIEQ